jgi:uncharacterized protein (DUF2141 family)
MLNIVRVYIFVAAAVLPLLVAFATSVLATVYLTVLIHALMHKL